MLLKMETLHRIAAGEVTLAFRRWKRPTVKAGGGLLTPIGQLAIDAVERVEPQDIDDAQARAAGFHHVEELREELARKARGSVYRVTLRLAGPDPRVALREEVPRGPEEISEIHERLAKWDREVPWTATVLRMIADHPGVRAPDLAARIHMDKAPFKARVRKLKGLGLTESLKVGYRLSTRGEVVLRSLEEAGD